MSFSTFTKYCLIAIALQLPLPIVRAGTVLPVNNGDFEQSVVFTGQYPLIDPTQYWNLGTIPDWTVAGSMAGDYRPTAQPTYDPASFIDPYAGLNVAFVTDASISQILEIQALAFHTYTVSVAVGRRYEVLTPQDFAIQLFGGTTPIINFTGSTSDIPLGGWRVFTASGTVESLSGDNASLQLVLSGGSSLPWSAGQIVFDNVSLSDSSEGGDMAPIPEPATIGLFGVGLAAIAFSKFRHSSSRQ
jgi:hypothetical protein